MADRMISVEVVHLDDEHQWRRRVEVVDGSTVLDAIDKSGMAREIPAGRLDPCQLGIFSKRVSADHVVQAGDRIEIYRPLLLDPMEARRRRAR
jgi:putative ubiquitin-RnfH superfamily antitoxin RatB of RatAB toxin-antitoxin module